LRQFLRRPLATASFKWIFIWTNQKLGDFLATVYLGSEKESSQKPLRYKKFNLDLHNDSEFTAPHVNRIS
jgi:hypothetical protein